MIWKNLVLLAIVFVATFSLSFAYVDEKLSDEDIEETSELIVNYLAPLLELQGLSMKDFPKELKNIVSKYYLIFSRQVEPLNILEKMISDYEIVINNLRLDDDELQQQIENFIEGNKLNKKKVLDKFVAKLQNSFNFELQVVNPKDAIKLLLFQEAYPDLMDLVSSMVRKHHEAYVNERAKQKDRKPNEQNVNNKEDDDFDLTATVRDFVAVHGRLELIKRMLDYLDQFIPPVNHQDISESTLDYLDDLQGYLVQISEIIWDYLKGSSYTKATDKLIKSSEDMLRDFLTIFPFQEILNFFDAVVLNPNDKRAAILLRYQRALRRIDNRNFDNDNDISVTNFKGILIYILEAVENGYKSIHQILRSTVLGEKKVSEESFLKFIDDELAPYDMSSKDLSKDMLAIFSRTFQRIKSFEDYSITVDDKKRLDQHMQYFRQNLEKVRDAFRQLAPDKVEESHALMESLLQTQVNKYGPIVEIMEQTLVSYFNSRFEKSDKSNDRQYVDEEIAHFVQKLDTILSIFQESGKKPSDLLKERLAEIVDFIDGFVMFANF